MEELIAKEEIENLTIAIKIVLSEEQRKIIEIIFYKEMHIYEAAKEFGISSQAMGKKLRKCLKILREYLENEEINR